jgi:hypothetical protein
MVLSGLMRTVVGSDERGGAYLGGGTIQLRLRAIEDLALDVGFAAMGGPEDGDRSRVETNGFVDLLWYPGGDGDFRAYFLFGGEVVGATTSWDGANGVEHSIDHVYAGPRGGLGIETGGSDWSFFFDGVYAPRFPVDQAAAAQLRGEDYRVTIQLRAGLVTWW